MTDYKSIVGKAIKSLTANPDNDQAEGQIWYNSTDGVFRNVVSSGAFSSSANMITKSRLMAGFGTQTAAVSAGVMNGASIVRVHDVKSMKRVVKIIEKIRNV